MSLETMAFILGGLLIAASVFGGGLEIKELKMPQIGTVQRAVAAVAGMAFVALALAINQKWIEHANESRPASVAEGSKTFTAPLYDGVRVDVCVEWAKRCGEEAATAWCRTQGYSRATHYPMENVGLQGLPTKLIGTQSICSKDFCTSFSEVTCNR